MVESPDGPGVHLVCGYNGSGKTTYAKQLQAASSAVRFSLDDWMKRLHPDLAYDNAIYGTRAEDCKWVIWDIAMQFLQRGVDVILDWNQWSRQRRKTWRDAAMSAGFDVRLYFIDVPVETAVHQAAKRAAGRSSGSHRLVSQHVRDLAEIFEPPSADEGTPITIIRP